MNYYAQPEDELIIAAFLEDEDHADLKRFLREQSQIEKVVESGMAFDHALDPHQMVEKLRYAHLDLKLTHAAMELGKATVTAAVGALVKGWVDKRNAAKQKAIEAKEAEILLFDQFGHRINIRTEGKKRNRS